MSQEQSATSEIKKNKITDPIEITGYVIRALYRLAKKKDRFYSSKEIHAQIHANTQSDFQLDFEVMEDIIMRMFNAAILTQLTKPGHQDPFWCLESELGGVSHKTTTE